VTQRDRIDALATRVAEEIKTLRLQSSTVANLPTGLSAADAGKKFWCTNAHPYNIGAEVVWTGTRYARVSDGQPPGQRVYRTGTGATLAANESVTTTVALAANVIRAYPWEVKAPLGVSSVSSEVLTAVASTSYRFGIYSDTGALYPSSLIANSDAVAFDSSAAVVRSQSLAANILLLPGIYWLAVKCNGTPSVRAIPVSAIPPLLGHNPAQGANSQRTAYTIGETFGAMPATFPAGATILNNNAAPLATWTVV
jgi:hypothetical protein